MYYVPRTDATVVARLRKAGAILLGKTNTPEFTLARGGIAGVNAAANIIYGISRNPYDQTRTTSGSSGGAGAIVAAAGVPFDIGTDWGGSIRGPAHANGIAGIKPTTGRVPRTGHIVDYGGIYDSWQQVGPLARRVEDLTLILPIIAGPDFRDAAIAPVPWADPAGGGSSKAARCVLSGQRSGRRHRPKPGTPWPAAPSTLEESGCQVHEDLPKDLLMEMEDIRHRLTNADGWTFVKRMADKWGTKAMSPALTDLMRANEPVSTAEFTDLLERQDDSRRRLLHWVSSYDVVLCPAGGEARRAHQSRLRGDQARAWHQLHGTIQQHGVAGGSGAGRHVARRTADWNPGGGASMARGRRAGCLCASGRENRWLEGRPRCELRALLRKERFELCERGFSLRCRSLR